MSNQGDTETDAYDRTRTSCKKLLAALIEHHDYRVPKPPKTIPIFEVPPTAEKIDVCVLPIASSKITIDAIKRVVCNHYGISHSDIISPRRDKKVGRPRMVAIYLSREFTEFGLPTIGRRFGNRDHTTALHSIRRMADLIMTDPVIAADVKSLSEQLTA
jgi:hypothetical protein